MKVTSWFSKMLGMPLRLDNLENLLVLQLEDLASAESQLIDALPHPSTSLQLYAINSMSPLAPRRPTHAVPGFS